MGPSQIRDDGLIRREFSLLLPFVFDLIFTAHKFSFHTRYAREMIIKMCERSQFLLPAFVLEFFRWFECQPTQADTLEPESIRIYMPGLGDRRDIDEKRLKVE